MIDYDKLPVMLVLYQRDDGVVVNNMEDSIDAFRLMRNFRVVTCSANEKIPSRVAELSPAVIVMHYSCFGWRSKFFEHHDWLQYLKRSKAYKVAFFQDEYYWFNMKRQFVESLPVNCAYSCFEEDKFDITYNRSGNVLVKSYYPAYISNRLIAISEKSKWSSNDRFIDFGYRGRSQQDWMGKLAHEKQKMGDKIGKRLLAHHPKCVVDTTGNTKQRLMGNEWEAFVISCRTIGATESGTDFVDWDNKVHNGAIKCDDDSVQLEYRTISPKNLEAAVLGTTQVLMSGQYRGVLIPGEDYIEVKDNYSNLDEVCGMIMDKSYCYRMAKSVREKILDNVELRWSTFMEKFENRLLGMNLDTKPIKTRGLGVITL